MLHGGSEAEGEVFRGSGRGRDRHGIGFVPLTELFAWRGERGFAFLGQLLQGLLAFAVEAAEFGHGTGVGTLQGGNLSDYFEQELAGGGVAEDGGVDFFGGGAFVEEVR